MLLRSQLLGMFAVLLLLWYETENNIDRNVRELNIDFWANPLPSTVYGVYNNSIIL